MRARCRWFAMIGFLVFPFCFCLHADAQNASRETLRKIAQIKYLTRGLTLTRSLEQGPLSRKQLFQVYRKLLRYNRASKAYAPIWKSIPRREMRSRQVRGWFHALIVIQKHHKKLLKRFKKFAIKFQYTTSPSAKRRARLFLRQNRRFYPYVHYLSKLKKGRKARRPRGAARSKVALRRACLGPFRNIRNPLYPGGDSLRTRPADWCGLVLNAGRIRVAARSARRRRGSRNRAYRSVEKGVRGRGRAGSNGRGTVRLNRFQQRRLIRMNRKFLRRKGFIPFSTWRITKKMLKRGPLRPSMQRHWDELQGKIKKYAGRWSFKCRYRYPAGERKIAERYRGLGFRVYRVRMCFSYFSYKRNRWGKVVRRVRTGEVMYRVPGETLCRVTRSTVKEAHVGGGRFAFNGKFSSNYRFRFLRCR